MEQHINKLMTFAEVQCSGGAEEERWGSTAVPWPSLDDSSIKSQRPALCRQTRCALVYQYVHFRENRTVRWYYKLKQE